MNLQLIIMFLFLLSCSTNNISDSNSPIETEDCEGVMGGSAEDDICGVCGGDGSTCSDSWPIYYDSSEPIGGFQFDIDGEVNVISVAGGIANSSGFSMVTGNNRVLGFSFSGTFIPAGDGVLLLLTIAGSGVACLSEIGLVISSDSGVELSASIQNCNTIYIQLSE